MDLCIRKMILNAVAKRQNFVDTTAPPTAAA